MKSAVFKVFNKCIVVDTSSGRFQYHTKFQHSTYELVILAVSATNCQCHTHTYTHTHPFNGPFSGTTQVSRYQKGGTNLDFTEARDSEWQWHQLGQMQVCTLLQTDNHTSIPPLSFLQAGCPSCRPTNTHIHIIC